jgi:SAM-dependent methyltransferase
MNSARYYNPMTGEALLSYKKTTLGKREIPDLRSIGAPVVVDDEYNSGDPYPKDEAREQRLGVFVRDVVLKLAPELADKSCVMLDAGCGTGDWSRAILANTPHQHRLDVAEYSPLALAVCLDQNPRIENACLFDANFPPFEPLKFDVIIAINIFEHIKAPALLIEGLLKSLKDDGVIIVSTPSRYRLKNIIKACLGRRVNLIHDLHVTEYSVGQVKEMVGFVGGSVTKTAGTSLADPEEKFYFLTLVVSTFAQWFLKRILGSGHLLYATVYYRIEKNLRK